MSAPKSKSASGNAGFTLLEVLITAVLLATLMTGIWGLYRMFATLYETGYVRIEKAQLIRSVTQQLADDLAGTVLPQADEKRKRRSPGGGAGAEEDFGVFTLSGTDRVASSADRVGFLGTHDGMRLDVLQTEPPTIAVQDSIEMQYSPVETMVERSAEIVTVIYSFQPPSVTEDWFVAEPGLKRQEFRLNQSTDFGESASGDEFAQPTSSPIVESAVEQGESRDQEDSSYGQDQSRPANRLRVATMYLPEIVAMEFRYFDGEKWTDAWDSRVRHALPRAVEVALQIEFDSHTTLQISEAEEILPVEDEPMLEDEAFPTTEPDLFADVDEFKAPRLPIHRFVIHLPQAFSPSEENEKLDAPDDWMFEDAEMPPLPEAADEEPRP